MKNILQILAFCCFFMSAAQINISNGGVVTVGENEMSFVDSGGALGNYSNNEAHQITICPDALGNYVQLEFLSFQTESFLTDLMTIYNGKDTNGKIIASFGGDTQAIPQELFAVKPFGYYIASSDASGCITIAFESDANVTASGWEAKVTSTSSFGGNALSNRLLSSSSVCDEAAVFCADAGALEFANVSAADNVADAPQVVVDNSCLASAPNPSWYFIEIQTAGMLEFDIVQTTGPNGTGATLDVDYVVWGPFANQADACIDFTRGDCDGDHNCTGTAVDCSFSASYIEQATIPNAQAGEFYMFLITNYSDQPGFITLNQTNEGGGGTNCCPFEEGVNPTGCDATDGEIQISLLEPDTSYTVTYTDPDGNTQTVTINSNASGVGVISGLGEGTYTNIDTGEAGCTSNTIVLSTGTVPEFNSLTSNDPICTGTDAVFTINGTAGATVSYVTSSNGAQIVVLDASGNAVVSVPGVTADETISLNQISLNGCDVVLTDTTATVVVIPENTIALNSGAGTDTQTVCIDLALTNITYATTGATGATITGLPSGVTGLWAGDVVTISGSPDTAVGSPFNYTVTLTGGCGNISATGTIAVILENTIALSSAAGTDTQTVCINTALTRITYATTAATGATITGLPSGVTGSWAGDVVTISGSPDTTVGSPFTYTVTLTGGCELVSAIGTITVIPDNTIALTSAAGTDAQTLCVNTSITAITYATTGATGATITGLPSGVAGVWAGDVVVISGMPDTSLGSPFTYTVTLTGGCGDISATGTIDVSPDNTIALSSAVGTDGQTVCINTALSTITYDTTGATGATITGLPSGVTGSWAGDVVTISGSPDTLIGAPFAYTVTLTGGCELISATGTIDVNPDSTIALNSGVGTDTQTRCINTSIMNIIYTTTGATGATITGLPNGVTGSWAGDVVMISGSPDTTAGSPFTYTVTLTGGCGDISATGTIVVIPDNTISLSSAAGTDVQGVCINSEITDITYVTTGATGATITGLPTGITGSWSGGIVTISGSLDTLVGAPFTYTVSLLGGCGNISTIGTIGLPPDIEVSLSSAIETDNQTVCVNTPITDITYDTSGVTDVMITGLPSGVSGSWSGNEIIISGVPDINLGSPFNYTIVLTGFCDIISIDGIITVNPFFIY
jgi:hypothetical protein